MLLNVKYGVAPLLVFTGTKLGIAAFGIYISNAFSILFIVTVLVLSIVISVIISGGESGGKRYKKP